MPDRDLTFKLGFICSIIYIFLKFSFVVRKKDKNPVCPKCESSLAIHGQVSCVLVFQFRFSIYYIYLYNNIC